jgi:hypothetical protein
MFDGFDHTKYKDEVTERWGRDAYERSDNWWRRLSEHERKAFMQEQADIARDFGAARAAGQAADSDEVQAITARHHTWLGRAAEQVSKEYFTGLGEMYVADPRFTANYDKHGEGTAILIRDAMRVYADRNL